MTKTKQQKEKELIELAVAGFFFLVVAFLLLISNFDFNSLVLHGSQENEIKVSYTVLTKKDISINGSVIESYDFILKPKKSAIKNINFIGLSSDDPKNIEKLRFEDIDADEFRQKNPEKENQRDFVKVYAIDPTEVEFEQALVTVTATGNSLYKCREWNFSEQKCYGEWELLKTGLIPGEEYNFTFTKEDPGFGEVIEVTDAMHLDKDRKIISDIYDEVKARDDDWSETISNEEYVRAIFEKNLTSSNDITLYPRIVSGNPRIKVYEMNETGLIAEFTGIIENEYNKVYLNNLQGTQDTFDLRVIGGKLEFDHIIDPSAVAYYDPTSDTQSGWSCTGSSCGTGHYTALDDGTRQPNAPTITDYIYQASNGGGVDEHNIDSISQSNVTNITLWAYVQTGSDHEIIISLQNDGTEVGTTTVPVGTSSSWVSINWNNPSGIGNISAEFSSNKNGGGKPANGWVYAWYVKVDYIAPDNPPNVTQNKPENGYSSAISDPVNVTFNCSAEDDIGLSNVSLYITNSANQSFSLNQTTDLSGTSDSVQWILELSNGNYTWNCLVYDNNPQSDWADNRSVEINYQAAIDNPPLTTLVSPANDVEINSQRISFKCKGDDDIELSNMTFYWNYSGTWQANETKSISGTSDSATFQKSSLNNTLIKWNCLACDNSSQCDFGNSNYTARVNYTSPTTCYYLSISPTAYTDNGGISTNPTNAYDGDHSTFASFNMGTTGDLDYYTYTNTENFKINLLNVTFDLLVSGVVNDQWGLQYSDDAGNNWYDLNPLGPTNFPRDNLSYQIAEQTAGEDGTWNFTEIQDDLRVRVQVAKSGSGDGATFNIYETFAEVCTEDQEPNVTLNSPADNYYNDTTTPINITFNCSAEDDHELINLSLYITNNSNKSFSLNQTTALSGTSDSAEWILELSNGNYTWNCLVEDAYGYEVFADSNRSLRINADILGPVVNTVNDTPDPVDPGNTINISANVTDNFNVSMVWVEINSTNYTMNYSGSGDIYFFDQFNTDLLAGLYTYTVYANDTSSNNATPASGNFTINCVTSINITNNYLNFSITYPGKTVNATAGYGYPINITNLGNCNANITLIGDNLLGQTDSSVNISVDNVHWDTTLSFSSNYVLNTTESNGVILNYSGLLSMYFRLDVPSPIKAQDYEGNITFRSKQAED